MVFVVEAFAAWLIEQVAVAGRKWLGTRLLGREQNRALQQAASAAMEATARQLRPRLATTDDTESADHMVRVIDQVFGKAPTPAESLAEGDTLLEGLQAAVAARLAVLDDVRPETGRSSADLLGVSVPELANLLTERLIREVLIRGAGGGPLTALADQLNHDITHSQSRRLAENMQVVLAALAQVPSIPSRTTPPPGRPVHELTDPFAFEVHRAIDAPGASASLPLLPAYVERDHDRRLRAVVKQASAGRSTASVLVGGSSTGKTRACWEAVQALPHEWRLWHPIDPSRPEAAAEALPAVGPRTVIWLNEAQHYLLTPQRGLVRRSRLGSASCCVIPSVGRSCCWAPFGRSTGRSSRGLRIPSSRTTTCTRRPVQLFTGIDLDVPDAFTGPSLRAVQAAAKADPRLDEAAEHAEDGRVTQFLAGAPALLERYRTAPAAARALIEAAMDARRLGHGLYLPYSLLDGGTGVSDRSAMG